MVRGGVDDEIFIRRTLSSVLMLLMGATRGVAHDEVREAFTLIQTDSNYRDTLLADARLRIDAALSALGKPTAKRARTATKMRL